MAKMKQKCPFATTPRHTRIEVEQIARAVARRFGDSPEKTEAIYQTTVELWDRIQALKPSLQRVEV